MANVLLVSAPYAEAYGRMTPPVQIHLGLAYVASVLEENGHTVEVVDTLAEGIRLENFAAIIKRKNYDVAGFTVTTPTFYSSLALAKAIKKHSPKTLTVFGGIHPTIKPRQTVRCGAVDVVVKGEGEITFKEIVNSVKRAGGLSNVKGILYKKGGEIIETPSRPPIENLDILPFPARHLFKNKQYTYPDALYRNTVPIFTSRGCPGRCSFCITYRVLGRVFRARSAGNVVDEVEFIVKKLGAREIHIWDDNFTTIKKRVFEIRDEIRKRNLKVKFAFPNGIRADFLNEEIIEALKEMGTYSISVGVESGSQDVLDKAHKGVKLERVEEIFNLARKFKIETWAFFMLGLPGENRETLARTIDFAKRLDPDIAKFHILKPYPGSEVYDYLRSRNFLLTEDYNRFGIHTPPVHRLEHLMPADILKWQKKAYMSFYLRPSKIIAQILRTKSLNRFLLNFQSGLGLAKLILFKGR